MRGLALAATAVLGATPTLAAPIHEGAAAHELPLAAGVGAGAVAMVLIGGLAAACLAARRSRDEARAANRRLAEANDRLEKALKARTDLLATTSHEIRTPLNGILGMAEVILHDPSVAGLLRERIEVVRGAGETMKALAGDILDMAKIEAGGLTLERSEMDLHRVLTETVRLWSGEAEAKGLALSLDQETSPARIVEDEARLRQILSNLLSNAIKFSAHGSVRVTAAAESAAGGERLLIGVEDSGIGIAPEQLARIFEPFRQADSGIGRRYGGTGLGLAICRDLARAMGGDVTVASRPGAGSTFLLALPLVRPDPLRHSDETPLPPASLASRRLLLVDRNPLNRSIVRAVIESEVRAFAVAASGDEAIDLLRGGGIDEVIVEGGSAQVGALDPLASVGEIAAAAPDAVLTVLWANPSESDRIELARRGAARVLARPIAPQALLAALKSRQNGAAPPQPDHFVGEMGAAATS